jgi:hypothetical protein
MTARAVRFCWGQRDSGGPDVVLEAGYEGDSIVPLCYDVGQLHRPVSLWKSSGHETAHAASSLLATEPRSKTAAPTHLRSDQLETRELTPGLLLDDRLDLRVRLGERGVQALVLSHGVSMSCPSSNPPPVVALVARARRRVALTKSWGMGTDEDILIAFALRWGRREEEMDLREVRRLLHGGLGG